MEEQENSENLTSDVMTSPPTYIITLDELKQSQEATQSKESADKSILLNFLNPSPTTIRTYLLKWASANFPDGYNLFSIEITPPLSCSDGVSRGVFEYANYLLQTTLGAKVRELQDKLPGMLLSYSLVDNKINIHVSKA